MSLNCPDVEWQPSRKQQQLLHRPLLGDIDSATRSGSSLPGLLRVRRIAMASTGQEICDGAHSGDSSLRYVQAISCGP